MRASTSLIEGIGPVGSTGAAGAGAGVGSGSASCSGSGSGAGFGGTMLLKATYT